jgi:hypothetical protein
MERLIELISLVEDDTSISVTDYLSTENPIVKEISIIANNLLITDGGACHWENIDFLNEQSIHVFAIEEDRFGWIIGGVQTKKGTITYG